MANSIVRVVLILVGIVFLKSNGNHREVSYQLYLFFLAINSKLSHRRRKWGETRHDAGICNAIEIRMYIPTPSNFQSSSHVNVSEKILQCHEGLLKRKL